MRKLSKGLVETLTREMRLMHEDYKGHVDALNVSLQHVQGAREDQVSMLEAMQEISLLISEGCDSVDLPKETVEIMEIVSNLSDARHVQIKLSDDDVRFFFGDSVQEVWYNGNKALACNTEDSRASYTKLMRQHCCPESIVRLLRDYAELPVSFQELKSKQND